ncbi:MAG: nucleotidyl transferase AbiEii/AbiGii toxin family protein [Chitinophagaceae bacterium]|nr:nucleotidyl transferase AbiEii/AbiGii toxin family protein [Chitinophagaceae bacterium]
MNTEVIKIWQQLGNSDKQAIFTEVSANKNIPPAAVEKDWWVVRTLETIYDTSIAAHVVFKGGTSLSKAWGLIDRFSEDIDLALDRRFLGFNQTDAEMTASQVAKLRKHSFKFIHEMYLAELKDRFIKAGLTVTLDIIDVTAHDNDPLKIAVYYPATTEKVKYLQPRILIEIGSRSLIEPFVPRSFTSLVGEQYAGRPFADLPITVPTVTPDRTFLEKIFLLHEEFQLPIDRIRVERKSRHLYDLEKLMDTEYATSALDNVALYQTLVAHRKAITPIRGIDYANHLPKMINPLPPEPVLQAWEEDYRIMQESMIYNPSLSFVDMIVRIKELKERVNILQH